MGVPRLIKRVFMRNENIIYFTRVKYFTAYNWVLQICYDLFIRPAKPKVNSHFVNFVDAVKPGPLAVLRVCTQYFKLPMIQTRGEMDTSI
jgi:hypothetical protein